MDKQKVIVICGPTASGKTKLSIELAKKINGEIVSCDSMQIYQDMTIGTAKPTTKEMEGIPHHLIDCVLPTKRYSVADYQKDALKVIDEILKRGKVPIVVGGTGLYIHCLITGIRYHEVEDDLSYRDELEKIVSKQGLEKLYQRAKQIDPEAMQIISENDKKRIFRVLEIYHATGKTKTQIEMESRQGDPIYHYLLFGIQMEREKLYERINLRVDLMLKEGLIEEVSSILKKYDQFPTAMQGLGYKEVVEYFNHELTKEEMIEKIKRETRRYAKRQLTWFRRYQDIIWLDGLGDVQNNIGVILEEYSEKKD